MLCKKIAIILLSGYNKYNIDAQTCMCFGDNNNDIKMMKIISESYGMRYGTLELQNSAKHIIEHPLDIMEMLV